MRPFTLPDWTRDLPDSTNLNTKDLALIYKIKTISHIAKLVRDGKIPLPYQQLKAGFKHTNTHMLWKLGTLRKLSVEQTTAK